MRTLTNEVAKNIGKKVSVSGWIHKIRKLGGITFLVIRDRAGIIQAVVEKKEANKVLEGLSTESVVEITGKVVKEERAPEKAEIRVEDVKIISKVTNELPIEINKKELNVNLDTLFDNRPLSLRSPHERAIFKVQAQILKSFRDFMTGEDFVEICSPKIVEEGLETGGAEMFDLKWFGKKAFLSQSPQMYKQVMIGVFERVFETSQYWRAEKHNTSRHMNEFYMLDFEMGFIDSWEEIMDVSEGFVKKMTADVKKECKQEFALLGADIPETPKKIPRMKLTEAQKILESEFKEKCLGEPDLDPKQEKLLCEYTKKKFGSEFVFVTHYPSKKRAFYSYDDPKNPKETLTFDLLFRGLEITSGGQRLHKYEDYIKKIKERGLDPKYFEDYLMTFKYGMPPHGGTGWGLNRMTTQMLNLSNIREGALFPRDINRLRP